MKADEITGVLFGRAKEAAQIGLLAAGLVRE